MKLVWFELNGYKRFSELTKINLDEKLVAIVGPNEAGKTSLLQCMEHYNHRKPFASSGGSQELTRGKELSDDETIAEWTFAIDDRDRETLSSIPEAKEIRWYSISKKKNGKAFFSLTPKIKRSLSPRKSLLPEIQELCNSGIPSDDSSEEDTDDQPKLAEEVLAILMLEDESLTRERIDKIAQLAERLESEGDDVHRPLIDALWDLHGLESLDPPTDRAGAIFAKIRPSILFFESSDRNLLSEYDLDSFFREPVPNRGISRESIPTALHNLASAANLDLADLHDAQKQDDRGRVRTILEKAQDIISGMLEASWTQSRLSLSLELDGFRFQILLRSEKGEYVKVVERSDGLRQFLALLLFLKKHPKSNVKPILLIDEAESHLHYDAQADLAQTLATQELAAKVIYTTHSIGCLPEDLGSGVRMVWAEDPHSSVDNWFWNTQRPGFSPLLFAMGANTLAFIPMRYALIAEGAADMILLPAILKDGLEKDSLGFQVVPGLSDGTRDEIAIIDNEAALTAYLCDGDGAGNRLKAKVRAAGVPENMIITLPEIDGDETVIEDYLFLPSYLSAVNEELRRSGCENVITEDTVTRPNRPKKIEEWCKKNGVSVPSKRAVAYHIIEKRYDAPVVDPDVEAKVEELYKLVAAALKLPA